MQSTNGTKRYVSAKMIASAARRREWVRRTLKAAMEAWTGPAGLLVLAFVASMVYVAFGGPFVGESPGQLRQPDDPSGLIRETAPDRVQRPVHSGNNLCGRCW